MPVDMSRYPTNWLEIYTSVKELAGWRCDCCQLAHNAEGYRDQRGNFIPLGINEAPPHGFSRLKMRKGQLEMAL